MLFQAACHMSRGFMQPIARHINNSNSLLSSCTRQVIRFKSNKPPSPIDPVEQRRIRTITYYCASGVILVTGLTYAAVPLYRMFCQSTGYGGTTSTMQAGEKVQSMEKVKDRVIRIRFSADTQAAMQWNFRPLQYEVKVAPGETALAFYTAKNPTSRPVTGISTYNVLPFEAGPYFNKIQCFCFEEQQLNPHEEVDMPVFFYIDPDIINDPKMEFIDEITLAYTFFEAKESENLQFAAFAKSHS